MPCKWNLIFFPLILYVPSFLLRPSFFSRKLHVWTVLVIYSLLPSSARSLFWLLFRIVVISNEEHAERSERNRDARFAYFSFYQSTRIHPSVWCMYAVSVNSGRIEYLMFAIKVASFDVWNIYRTNSDGTKLNMKWLMCLFKEKLCVWCRITFALALSTSLKLVVHWFSKTIDQQSHPTSK